VSGGELMVSRAAAARVIQRLVDERHDEDGRGGRGSLARECASRLARNPATLERAIYRVLNGYERRRDGSRYRRRTIAFSAIDQILTGADATHLWYGPELVRWGAARAGQTQPRRYPRRAEAKLTVPEIRTAHERYLAGESLRALGRAPFVQDADFTLYHGDARGDVLRELDEGVANCIVTSPPYYLLRDYDVDGQIGAEADARREYVEALVDVFREARRVLRDDGTVWLNLGDTYAAPSRGPRPRPHVDALDAAARAAGARLAGREQIGRAGRDEAEGSDARPVRGRVRAPRDGWWLRQV
jgi:hypothetical protein